MDTLGELVARDRRSDAIAIRTDPVGRAMSYHDFCTTAWKAGNFLRYLGVRSGDRVVVADDPCPEPVLALFGAALLGASVRFGVGNASQSPRVVVAAAERESEVTIPDGCRLLVYGGEPQQSRTAYWERDVWSENPAFPPTTVDAASTVLETATRSYSHAELLDAADGVVADLGAETTVAIREQLSQPGVVVAGVLAPLLASGTVVFPDEQSVCDVAVGSGPDPVEVNPESVLS